MSSEISSFNDPAPQEIPFIEGSIEALDKALSDPYIDDVINTA